METIVLNVPCVIKAACILHNVCEDRGDEVDKQWEASTGPLGNGRHCDEQHTVIGDNDPTANDIRNAVMSYFIELVDV